MKKHHHFGYQIVLITMLLNKVCLRFTQITNNTQRKKTNNINKNNNMTIKTKNQIKQTIKKREERDTLIIKVIE